MDETVPGRRRAENEAEGGMLKFAKGSDSDPERREGESRRMGEVGMVELKSHEAIESSPLSDCLRPAVPCSVRLSATNEPCPLTTSLPDLERRKPI